MNTIFENLSNWLDGTLIFLAAMLIIGLLELSVHTVFLYFIDITQTKHSIRRNYPIVGHFHNFLEPVRGNNFEKMCFKPTQMVADSGMSIPLYEQQPDVKPKLIQ